MKLKNAQIWLYVLTAAYSHDSDTDISLFGVGYCAWHVGIH